MSKPQPAAKPSTRERILEAAVEVFTRQGYDATTTRDIAAAAEVNIATLHYHYKSKEDLFGIVAADAMHEFNSVFERAVQESEGLEEFLLTYVREYTALSLAYPYLVGFVMTESERSPAGFDQQVDFRQWDAHIHGFITREAVKRQVPAPDKNHFIADMVGMLTFPFLMRKSLTRSMGMDDANFEHYVSARPQHITAVLMQRFA